MITLKQFLHSLPAAAAWMMLCVASPAQTTSRLSTTFLARGEQALLEISVVGAPSAGIPQIPPVDNLSIQFSGRGPQTNILPGRTLEYAYGFIVSSYETGRYVIPPVTVMVGGLETQTEPLEFEVFNPDELQWSEVQAGERTIRYAASFRSMNLKPFENETTPTEIKIFVPEEILVEDWGIPDFEREGLAAWRFQPSPMRSRINLLGQRYISVAYPSTITPTRVGQISIGPAKIRLTTQEVVRDPFPRAVNAEIYLQVPKLEIESMALPEGAPEGFHNAVGNFRLKASAAATEVHEGDPISVDLIVSGSGNLDTLHPPELENPNGWKIYGTTTEQRGDERRQLSGTVVFHQSIRPLEMKSDIPPFRLIYFDPRDEAYKTLTTEPIALQMRPDTAANTAAAAAAQSLAVPFERMTDILAVLRPAQLTLPTTAPFPMWLGHAAGALLALALLAKAGWMRFAPRFQKNPRRDAQHRELRE
ncbi:BatD family protein, partial [bacterium]|nr:BatD family protein [bacterium]